MKLQGVIIVALVGTLLTACQTPEGPYVAVANPNSPATASQTVILQNYDLTRTLAVDKPVLADRDPANRLRVQVGLRNRVDDENLQVQVQTLWMNDVGRVLYSEPGSEAAWLTMTISPNQTIYYSQSALTAEATRFSIRVRYTAKTK